MVGRNLVVALLRGPRFAHVDAALLVDTDIRFGVVRDAARPVLPEALLNQIVREPGRVEHVIAGVEILALVGARPLPAREQRPHRLTEQLGHVIGVAAKAHRGLELLD